MCTDVYEKDELNGKKINKKKLSILTNLLLNLPFLRCKELKFDQDLYNEEFSFKLWRTKNDKS